MVSYPDAEGKMSFVSADQQAIVVNVYAPAAGETVRMKLESSADSENVYIETDAVTESAGWQEVRFDFADLADTSPALDLAAKYDTVVAFPSFGSAGSGQTYFFDDVRILDAVPNAVPAFAAETVTVTANENMTAVYKAEAVDTDIGSSVSYTLAGADAGLFDIAADGTVTFKATPDFEGVGTDDNPGSAEGTNTYSFTVVADDGMGGVSEQAVTVNVTDMIEIVVGVYDPWTRCDFWGRRWAA